MDKLDPEVALAELHADSDSLGCLLSFAEQKYSTIGETQAGWFAIPEDSRARISCAAFSALHGPTCCGPGALQRVIRRIWQDPTFTLQHFFFDEQGPIPEPCVTCLLAKSVCHGKRSFAYEDDDFYWDRVYEATENDGVGQQSDVVECQGFPGAVEGLLALVFGRKLRVTLFEMLVVLYQAVGESNVDDLTDTQRELALAQVGPFILQAKLIKHSEAHVQSAMESLLPDLLRESA